MVNARTPPLLLSWQWGPGSRVPVSHIPLIILKIIPYSLNKYGKYPQNLESIVSPYPLKLIQVSRVFLNIY